MNHCGYNSCANLPPNHSKSTTNNYGNQLNLTTKNSSPLCEACFLSWWSTKAHLLHLPPPDCTQCVRTFCLYIPIHMCKTICTLYMTPHVHGPLLCTARNCVCECECLLFMIVCTSWEGRDCTMYIWMTCLCAHTVQHIIHTRACWFVYKRETIIYLWNICFLLQKILYLNFTIDPNEGHFYPCSLHSTWR